MQKSKSLFLTTFIAFIMRCVGVLASFIMTIVVARTFGANDSGLFFLCLTIIQVLSVFSRIGMDQTILRMVSDGSGYGKSAVTQAIVITGTVSTLFAFLLFSCANWLATQVFNKDQLAEILQAFSPALVANALFFLISFALQGLRKTKTAIFVSNIGVALIFCLVLLSFDVHSIKLAGKIYSAASISVFFISLLCWIRFTRKQKTSKTSIQVMAKSFLPLWVVAMMSQLSLWSSHLIAASYVSPEEIAWLSAAQRLAMLSSFILVAINMIFGPEFSQAYKQKNNSKLRDLAKSTVKIALAFSLPITIVMLCFPKLLLSVFGTSFTEGYPLLIVLAIGQFANVATGSVGYLLSMTGHEKDFRNNSIISATIAVTFSLALVPTIGVIGSAISTSCAIVAQNILGALYVKKRLGFNILAIWKTKAKSIQ